VLRKVEVAAIGTLRDVLVSDHIGSRRRKEAKNSATRQPPRRDPIGSHTSRTVLVSPRHSAGRATSNQTPVAKRHFMTTNITTPIADQFSPTGDVIADMADKLLTKRGSPIGSSERLVHSYMSNQTSPGLLVQSLISKGCRTLASCS
jgi:hypothetical protein